MQGGLGPESATQAERRVLEFEAAGRQQVAVIWQAQPPTYAAHLTRFGGECAGNTCFQ